MENKIDADWIQECADRLCEMVLPIVDIVAHKVASGMAARWQSRETVTGALPTQVIIEIAVQSVEAQLRRKMPAVTIWVPEPVPASIPVPAPVKVLPQVETAAADHIDPIAEESPKALARLWRKLKGGNRNAVS